ncbi:MAG: hypothetical protein QXF01_01255 [Candidatus Micrarchaeaceae archaeon]
MENGEPGNPMAFQAQIRPKPAQNGRPASLAKAPLRKSSQNYNSPEELAESMETTSSGEQVKARAAPNEATQKIDKKEEGSTANIENPEPMCPACTSTLDASSVRYAFCQFCEMFVGEAQVGNSVKSEKDALSSAMLSLSKGDLIAAAQALAPLDSSTDPISLYGAGNIYLALSNYTYADVNYSLSGFMYSNADKRNDEYNRNPNNSMHLLSKAKEMLFNVVYLVSKTNSGGWLYPYLGFISEMKLKRHAKAHAFLEKLWQAPTAVSNYARMVYLVDTGSIGAEKALKPVLDAGEPNSRYYLAKSIARTNTAKASAILKDIIAKKRMPMAELLLSRLNEILAATSL